MFGRFPEDKEALAALTVAGLDNAADIENLKNRTHSPAYKLSV